MAGSEGSSNGIMGRTSTALGNGTLEQAGCQRRVDEVKNRGGSGRLATNGDLRCITAKSLDILICPVKSSKLVVQTVVSRWHTAVVLGAQLWVGKVSQSSKSIVEVDYHHSLRRQPRSLIGQVGTSTALETAAIDPEVYRVVGLGGEILRGPDVEEQTVLVTYVIWLGTVGRKSGRILNASPVGWFWGVDPAVLPGCGVGESDAPESIHTLDILRECTLDKTIRDLDDGVRKGGSRVNKESAQAKADRKERASHCDNGRSSEKRDAMIRVTPRHVDAL